MNSNNLILIDTNVLIYATDKSSIKHAQALLFIRNNSSKLVLSSQVVGEYLRVVTHKNFSKPLTINKATKNIELFKKSFADFVFPNIKTHSIFIKLITKHKLVSNRIFDAYISAIALSNDISKIATFNIKDYKSFKDIDLISI